MLSWTDFRFKVQLFASSPLVSLNMLGYSASVDRSADFAHSEKLRLIGEHCQFMVNKTANFNHCDLCHDCIVIFLNFEHVYNQSRQWIEVE